MKDLWWPRQLWLWSYSINQWTMLVNLIPIPITTSNPNPQTVLNQMVKQILRVRLSMYLVIEIEDANHQLKTLISSTSRLRVRARGRVKVRVRLSGRLIANGRLRASKRVRARGRLRARLKE